MMKYSMKKEHKVTAGMGVLIKEKYKHNIEDTHYINKRRTTLDIGKEKIHLISIYAPDANKNKEEIDNELL